MYGAEGGTAGTITAGRGPDGTGVVMRGDVGMVGAERTVGTAGAATCVEKFAATNAESFVTSGASIAGRRAVRTKWRVRDRHLHRAEIDCRRPLKKYNAGASLRAFLYFVEIPSRESAAAGSARFPKSKSPELIVWTISLQ